MTLARDHFKKPESELHVMARNWAFKLERMSGEQRRLAEKFINEILFEGEEGNLHRHSVVIISPSDSRTEQEYLSSTEQPVMIHISEPQADDDNPVESEADTAAKFLQNFNSF